MRPPRLRFILVQLLELITVLAVCFALLREPIVTFEAPASTRGASDR